MRSPALMFNPLYIVQVWSPLLYRYSWYVTFYIFNSIQVCKPLCIVQVWSPLLHIHTPDTCYIIHIIHIQQYSSIQVSVSFKCDLLFYIHTPDSWRSTVFKYSSLCIVQVWSPPPFCRSTPHQHQLPRHTWRSSSWLIIFVPDKEDAWHDDDDDDGGWWWWWV